MTRAARVVATGLGLLLGVGCASEPEPLPEPWAARVTRAECFPPLPPPPLPPLIKAGADLGQCLAPSSPHESLPVEVHIAATGRATRVRFYSQCSGEEFTVAADVEACILDRLKSWEWLTVDTCPVPDPDADEHQVAFLVALRQPRERGGDRTAQTTPAGTLLGCAGEHPPA
jgi:hypothetical protein